MEGVNDERERRVKDPDSKDDGKKEEIEPVDDDDDDVPASSLSFELQPQETDEFYDCEDDDVNEVIFSVLCTRSSFRL